MGWLSFHIYNLAVPTPYWARVCLHAEKCGPGVPLYVDSLNSQANTISGTPVRLGPWGEMLSDTFCPCEQGFSTAAVRLHNLIAANSAESPFPPNACLAAADMHLCLLYRRQGLRPLAPCQCGLELQQEFRLCTLSALLQSCQGPLQDKQDGGAHMHCSCFLTIASW